MTLRVSRFRTLLAKLEEEAEQLAGAGRPECASVVRRCALIVVKNYLNVFDRYVTVREAAEIAGRSECQIRRWIKSGRIKSKSDPTLVYVAQLPFSTEDGDDLVKMLRKVQHELNTD